jgi:Fe-S cluster assembly scaffold protein SufB
MNANAMTKTVRLYEDSKAHGVCRGCEARMDWYDTLNGKKMPMNAGAVPLKSENEAGTGRVIAFFAAEDSHWNTCPERKQFSRDGR